MPIQEFKVWNVNVYLRVWMSEKSLSIDTHTHRNRYKMYLNGSKFWAIARINSDAAKVCSNAKSPYNTIWLDEIMILLWNFVQCLKCVCVCSHSSELKSDQLSLCLSLLWQNPCSHPSAPKLKLLICLNLILSLLWLITPNGILNSFLNRTN